jgi:hypothetical protein
VGFGFVGKSSFAFAPLLFAEGALLAGQIASRISYNGQSLLAFKMIIAGFVAFFVVAVLAPPLLFTPQLVRAKREGLAEYGALPLRMSWILIKNGCITRTTMKRCWEPVTYSHSLISVTALQLFVRCVPFLLRPMM